VSSIQIPASASRPAAAMRLGRDQAAPEEPEIDLGVRREHAHDERSGRHLEREDRDPLACIDRCVAAYVEREGRLPHRGTGREDEQVTRLQSPRHLVEFFIPGREARQLSRPIHQHINVVHRIVHLDRDARQARARLLRREAEDAAFRLVEQLVGGLAGLVAETHDLRGRRDQAAFDRAIANDFRVVHDVGGGGLVIGDLGQRDRSPDRIQHRLALEIRRQRRQIDGLILVPQT
jgi:hypothetical protein